MAKLGSSYFKRDSTSFKRHNSLNLIETKRRKADNKVGRTIQVIKEKGGKKTKKINM